MRTEDFNYHLPQELIAQSPLTARDDSRMLMLARSGAKQLQDSFISRLPEWLKPSDLLLFNNTKVLKARLFAVKLPALGRVEILIERVLSINTAVAHLRASKAPRAGTRLQVAQGVEIEVTGRLDDLFLLSYSGQEGFLQLLEQHGHVPLPPYIQRADEIADIDRYQTVYAQELGAVAAPTAGLHFSAALLEQIQTMGVGVDFVTLHVGAGTFKPVRVERLEDHAMHSEWISVSAQVCARVAETLAQGGRVIAVGTTVVRALETAAAKGALAPFEGETAIFIYPGYQFKSGLSGLLTNFHLPQSTLLMLVCAFSGKPEVMAAYDHAVRQKYRFFSYGDAMLLL